MGGDLHIGDQYFTQQPEPPSLFVNVPPLPDYFIGRGALVREIVSRLLTNTPSTLSIDGLPGVGKTTLAVAIAYDSDVLAHFSDGVLWAGLGPNPDVMSVLGAWADALNVDVTDKVTAGSRSLAIRNAIGQRHYLLVIDDAWDEESARWLCCGGPYCCHLLTTRNRDIARAFAGFPNATTLPELSLDAALTLLQHIAPEVVESHSEGARRLVERVGYLPLAVELVGGYLADTVFESEFHSAITHLIDPAERLKLAQTRLGNHNNVKMTLRETISLSLYDLTAEVVQAFYALGAFAPKPAAFDLPAALAVASADIATIKRLVVRNLVHKLDGDRLTIHQIVADVARDKLTFSTIQRHCNYYLQQVNKDREDWRYIEAVYPQLKHAWKSVPKDEGCLEIIWAVQSYQQRRGLWNDLLLWQQAGLGIASLEDTARLAEGIGWVYCMSYEYQQALDHFQRAMAIREEVGDCAGLAKALDSMGWVYLRLDEYERALDYTRRALSIREEIDDRVGLAESLEMAGRVYLALDEYKQALEYFERARSSFEEVGERARLAEVFNSIGQVYLRLDEYKHALDFFQRALSIQEETGDLTGLAHNLEMSGRVYLMLDEYESALGFFLRALSIREKIGDRGGIGDTLDSIGRVYLQLDEYGRALGFLQRALSIQEEIGDRSAVAQAARGIGDAYYYLDQYRQALGYYQRALSIFEEIDDRLGVANCYSDIGSVCLYLDQYHQALDCFQRASSVCEEIGEQSTLATALSFMGDVYVRLEDYQQALRCFDEALSIHENVGDRAGTVGDLIGIGRVYEYVGNYQGALEHLQHALGISKEINDRAYLAQILTHIGTVRGHLGDYQQALENLVRASDISSEISNPYLLADALNRIGEVYSSVEDHQQALHYLHRALFIWEEIGAKYKESNARYTIAKVLQEQDELVEAETQLRRAVELGESVQSPRLEQFKEDLVEVRARLTTWSENGKDH